MVSQPTSSLGRFLTGDTTSEPALEALRATGLIGHAFTRLPQHPRRAQLREGFLFLAARHVTARRAIADLVKAWNDAGLIPFVFKGFHLAEFVYPAPGHRGYADVDMVIAEEDVASACRIATTVGWNVAWQTGVGDDLRSLHGPEYRGHEAAHLQHASLDLKIDLHRRIVHNVHNQVDPPPVARRLTAAALEAAETVSWEGARLRIPGPVDAVVFGLALNRCWGSDGWRVKPRDYADAEALAARGDVSRGVVMARASSLGVAHTVGVFIDRCDPARRRLDLRDPPWWTRRRWELQAWGERGPVDALRMAMGTRALASDAVALASVLPVVADTRRRMQRGDDPSTWRPAPGPESAPGHVGSWAWRRLRRALHRSLRLLRIPAAERADLAVLSAYRLLRSRGVPVEFDLGSSDTGPAATLSLDGRPLKVHGVEPGAE